MATKTKTIFAAVLTIAISLLAQNIKAQKTREINKVYGVVVDSATKKPLSEITVQLIADSNVSVTTSLTAKDGAFSFQNLSARTYKIKLTAVGYQTTFIKALIDSSQTNVNVGTIYISRSSNNLKEVVVTATRPVIKQDIDKITYDLQADPESKGSSVLEMMRKVPFLSIDGENNILLNGSSSYKILINGKPSVLVEKNPKDILRSMPASTIKSIEVITSPSSKYDGEGLAGIINIITNQKIDNGYNGTINATYKYPVGGPGAGVSFSFKLGKIGISVLGGASANHQPQQNSTTTRNTTADEPTALEQTSSKKSDSKNNYLASELSYELDSLHLVCAQFNITNNSSDNSGSRRSVLGIKSGVLEQYRLNTIGDGNSHGMDAAINYQMGFKSSKERLLTLSYRSLLNQNNEFDAVDILNAVNFEYPPFNQRNKGRFLEQTFQTDYVQGVKKLLIEAGLKGILRKNESDYQFQLYDSASNNFESDKNRSNKFDNDQNILSAYNSYQYKLKTWAFKAGVRLEQTIIKAHFISSNTEVNQNYLNLIPAAAISKKLKGGSTLALNYTNRIQRPSIYQLNPFIDRSNPTLESSGNPDLKPGFTNILQLSYTRSKKSFTNIALTYMALENLLSPVSRYDQATNITHTSFENVGQARIVKINAFATYPLTKKWSFRLNSDLRYIAADFYTGTEKVRTDGVMFYLNLSNSYRFEKGWRLNGNVTINSGGLASIQGKTNGYISSNFSVQKDLIKDKLSFSGSLSNPFNKYRYVRDEIIGADFNQTTMSEIYYRSFGISLNYRFGKQKEAVKKNKRGISNDDVELNN